MLTLHKVIRIDDEHCGYGIEETILFESYCLNEAKEYKEKCESNKRIGIDFYYIKIVSFNVCDTCKTVLGQKSIL